MAFEAPWRAPIPLRINVADREGAAPDCFSLPPRSCTLLASLAKVLPHWPHALPRHVPLTTALGGRVRVSAHVPVGPLYDLLGGGQQTDGSSGGALGPTPAASPPLLLTLHPSVTAGFEGFGNPSTSSFESGLLSVAKQSFFGALLEAAAVHGKAAGGSAALLDVCAQRPALEDAWAAATQGENGLAGGARGGQSNGWTSSGFTTRTTPSAHTQLPPPFIPRRAGDPTRVPASLFQRPAASPAADAPGPRAAVVPVRFLAVLPLTPSAIPLPGGPELPAGVTHAVVCVARGLPADVQLRRAVETVAEEWLGRGGGGGGEEGEGGGAGGGSGRVWGWTALLHGVSSATVPQLLDAPVGGLDSLVHPDGFLYVALRGGNQEVGGGGGDA
jgi:hypothetical protein